MDVAEDRTLFNKLSVSGNSWEKRASDQEEVRKLKNSRNISHFLSELLVSRGITETQAEDYFNPQLKTLLPDPSVFIDMDKSIERVCRAIKNNEKITVFGDYDVDGATSSALLKKFFSEIPYDISVYIPDRFTEGYGPSIKAFTNIKESGCNLIITVDCGTASYEPIDYAQGHGIDVIILDHHQGQPVNPASYSLVNPNRADEKAGYNNLAACGVAFIFAVAISRELRKLGFFNDKPEPDLISLLDLVALGTVCDVVPLTGINRAFVRQGLKVLNKRKNIGITQLIEMSGITAPTLSVYHLGFIIGPRINAGGRVGKSLLGTTLLSANNIETAQKISMELNKLNEERKTIEQLIIEEAKTQARADTTPPIVFVSSTGWHQGIIGIVCSRLKDEFKKPTLVASIENNIAKGSARSIPGVDIGKAISKAKDLGIINTGGGHAMAAGFSLDAANLDKFKNFLIEEVSDASNKSQEAAKFYIDSAISIPAISNNTLKELEMMAPFGPGNLEPVFAVTNAQITRMFEPNYGNIRFIISDKSANSGVGINYIEATAFKKIGTNLGNTIMNHSNKKIHLAGQIRTKNNRRLELVVDDIIFDV